MTSLTAPALLQPTVDAIREERLDIDDYLDTVCARIDEVEPTVHALIPERHRRVRLGDEAGRAPEGPLHQIPVGIKDMFRVDGMETRAGSNLDPVSLSGRQAAAVNRLRDAGALILGKTVTCEFAFAEPGPTANPHDPAHTPGGSSSGSAAAVAAGYTPLAIGTQTVDSTLTPASYCGVVGFKPTHGRAPLDGAVPFSPAMDHIGICAQDVEGVEVAAGVLCDDWQPVRPSLAVELAVPVGRYLERIEPDTAIAFEVQLNDLREAGAVINEVPVLDDFEELYRTHYDLIAYEFAQVHRRWFGAWGFLYGEKAAGLYRKGSGLDVTAVADGLQSSARLRGLLDKSLDQAVAWVSPSTTGPAPIGLDSIGDPAMGLPWTHARVPAVTIPAGTIRGMPVGLQLAGRAGGDEALLAAARWIEVAVNTA